MNTKEIQKIIAEKVTGVWIPKHDDKGHHYQNTKTGKVVDSVTTQNVLDKPHLIAWAARLAVEYFIERMDFYDPKDIVNAEQLKKDSTLAFRAIRDNAGGIGNLAHDILENYVNEWIKTGVKPESITKFLDKTMPPPVWAACRSIEELFNVPNIEPIATELLVGSNKVAGAGTLDLLLLIDGEICLWDYKTSNQVNDHYAIQVGAYKGFFEEMTGLKVKNAAIVHLHKEYAKVKLYDMPFINRAYAVFKHQNAIYKWLKSGDKKLIERKNRLIIK